MVKGNKKISSKAPSKRKNWIKTHKLLSVGIAVLIVIFGIVSYNKYLDWQNVRDMERLLNDFEQLEIDMEQATGDDFYVSAHCFSVGKFSTSYACEIYLSPSDVYLPTYTKELEIHETTFLKNNSCTVASMGYKIKNPDKNYYICPGFHVREANEKKAEGIFIKYDTSPNSPA